jgi:uncharacterized peroxidase-related enzyme
MSHISLIELANTDGDTKALLQQIHGAFGAVPNMFRAVANSNAALKMMWNAFGALGTGVIPKAVGEKVAVAIANSNRCEYCLAAHTQLGLSAGASLSELSQAQHGQSNDAKTAAALHFALLVVRNRAQLQAADLQALRNAGWNDEEITELMAHIALNIFTNYINIAFDVPVDFPKIALA